MQVDSTDVNSDRDAGHTADIERRHTRLLSQESNPMKTNPPKIKDRVPKEPKAPRKQHMPLLTSKNVSACKALNGLPFEVLNQIINDLPLLTILDISSKPKKTSSERPNHCDRSVLSHIRYQHVFKDINGLQEICSLWSVYQAVWESTRLRRPEKARTDRHHHLGELMMLCRSSSTSTTLPDWQELQYEIHHRIIEVLSFVNVKRKIEALWDYADETLPDVTLINLWATYYEKVMANRTPKILYTTRDPDPPSRAQDWDPIHKAERHFVAMRSGQLLRMADLLEKHPRMLKVAVDPSVARA